MVDIDIKHICVDHAQQNIPLTFDEAYAFSMYAIEKFEQHLQRKDVSTELAVCVGTISALLSKATCLWKPNERDASIHGHQLPVDAMEQVAGIWQAISERILQLDAK